MRRFYKAHIMASVGALAADVTITVRTRAAQVLCFTAQHARALCDTDMGLKAEALRREAPLTALAQDASTDLSAYTEEVRSFLKTLCMPCSGAAQVMHPASYAGLAGLWQALVLLCMYYL